MKTEISNYGYSKYVLPTEYRSYRTISSPRDSDYEIAVKEMGCDRKILQKIATISTNSKHYDLERLSENEMIAFFSFFDKENKGELTQDEFITLGVTLNMEEAEVLKIFNEIDVNNDGSLSQAEYLEYFRSMKNKTESKFKAKGFLKHYSYAKENSFLQDIPNLIQYMGSNEDVKEKEETVAKESLNIETAKQHVRRNSQLIRLDSLKVEAENKTKDIIDSFDNSSVTESYIEDNEVNALKPEFNDSKPKNSFYEELLRNKSDSTKRSSMLRLDPKKLLSMQPDLPLIKDRYKRYKYGTYDNPYSHVNRHSITAYVNDSMHSNSYYNHLSNVFNIKEICRESMKTPVKMYKRKVSDINYDDIYYNDKSSVDQDEKEDIKEIDLNEISNTFKDFNEFIPLGKQSKPTGHGLFHNISDKLKNRYSDYNQKNLNYNNNNSINSNNNIVNRMNRIANKKGVRMFKPTKSTPEYGIRINTINSCSIRNSKLLKEMDLDDVPGEALEKLIFIKNQPKINMKMVNRYTLN